MIKMLLVIAAVVAVLIVGNVLEVKVHPEELTKVPERVISFARQPTTLEKARVTWIGLKRWGEQLIVRDDEKRFKLALVYLESDAERLKEMLADQKPVEATLSHASLVSASVQRVKDQLEKIPVDDLTALKEETRSSLATAQQSLDQLREAKTAFEATREKFSTVVSGLEEELAAVTSRAGGGQDTPPDVAGAQDKVPSSTPTPSATIPLTF